MYVWVQIFFRIQVGENWSFLKWREVNKNQFLKLWPKKGTTTTGGNCNNIVIINQPANQPHPPQAVKKSNYFSSGADMLTSLLRVLGALKKSQRAWPEWPNAIWAAWPDCRFVVSFFGISIKFSWQHKNNVIKIILHLFSMPAAKHFCSSTCWSLMYQQPKHLGSLESSLCRHVLSCLSYQKVQQQSRFQTRTTTIPSYFFAGGIRLAC